VLNGGLDLWWLWLIVPLPAGFAASFIQWRPANASLVVAVIAGAATIVCVFAVFRLV
jgi:hypothetical protein